MSATPARRLSRVFRRDHRALIVALDHGLTEGAVRGIENPAQILDRVLSGGADAVLTSYGVAGRFEQALSPAGLILRLDVGGTKLGNMGPGEQFFRVEDAVRLGADAVAVSGFPATPRERDTLRTMAAVIAQAHSWGMPVMAEMQPGGFDAGPEWRSTENVVLCARVAAELGADWCKVPYAEEFHRVVQSCFVPVVVLGGAPIGDPGMLFSRVFHAMQEGAAGVAIGRNVFQADDPASMVRALGSIIHGGVAAEHALQQYSRERGSPGLTAPGGSTNQ